MPADDPKKQSRIELLELLRKLGLKGLDDFSQARISVTDPFVRSVKDRTLDRKKLQDLGIGEVSILAEAPILLPYLTQENIPWMPILWIALGGNLNVRFQVLVASPEGRRFAYRWEHATQGDQHAYWHAQPLKAVTMPPHSPIDLQLQHDHISDRFPAFPLDARNAIELLAALLVSLYGLKTAITHVDDPSLFGRLHRAANTFSRDDDDRDPGSSVKPPAKHSQRKKEKKMKKK